MLSKIWKLLKPEKEESVKPEEIELTGNTEDMPGVKAVTSDGVEIIWPVKVQGCVSNSELYRATEEELIQSIVYRGAHAIDTQVGVRTAAEAPTAKLALQALQNRSASDIASNIVLSDILNGLVSQAVQKAVSERSLPGIFYNEAAPYDLISDVRKTGLVDQLKERGITVHSMVAGEKPFLTMNAQLVDQLSPGGM